MTTPENKPEFPSKRGNHHSTTKGYSVQAMFAFDSPRMIAGQIFDNRWREVSYQESVIGVPAASRFTACILQHGLFDYEAAQALRWWLHAVARHEGNEYCLRTRLVEHSIVGETTVTAERVFEEAESKRGLT